MNVFVIEAGGKYWSSDYVWNSVPDTYPSKEHAEKILKRKNPLLHAEYHEIDPCDIKIVEYRLVKAPRKNVLK